MEHPSYTPGLAPFDYHMFGALKKNLGGHRFDKAMEIFAHNFPEIPLSFFFDN